MKRLTPRKNCCDEAIKPLTLLKNWSDEAFNASSPRFIASSLSTLYKSIQKSPNKQSKTFQDTCKGKDDDVFQLCYGNYGYNKFFSKLPLEFIVSSILSVNIFFVKALRQWRQIWEAMKRWNFKYGKKLKQWSDEAFNSGKESEGMKRVTLHRIASLLVCERNSNAKRPTTPFL